MILFILRGAFLVLVAAVISLFVGSEFQEQAGFGFEVIVAIIGITIAIAAIVIAVDVSTTHKRLSSISGVFLGLIAGLLAAYALSFVVELVGVYTEPQVTTSMPNLAEADYETLSSERILELERQAEQHDFEVSRVEAFGNLLRGIKVIIGLVTCYVAISLVLQTKDDFRFVLPYVEFAKEIRGNRPTLLDTSVIVDGRVLDIVETQVMQGTLIVPKFVLDELQLIADSGDKIKRARGRRGLDILQKLQASDKIEVHIEEKDAEGTNVDQKLIALGQDLRARVMTNDFNLNKIATLRGVDVINMNDLAKALRPVVLPGEHMNVKLVKPGESGTQGVGYLDDGTMVVVEGGRTHLDHHVDLVVTSTLQTSAGRMIFGKFAHDEDEDGPLPAPAAEAPAGSSSDEGATPSAEAESPASAAPTEPEQAAESPKPSGRATPRPPSSRRNPRRG
ncbi:MAG: PIN/TRAM domain-containing protein [Planctomycetota bacterium]